MSYLLIKASPIRTIFGNTFLAHYGFISLDLKFVIYFIGHNDIYLEMYND